MPVLTVDAVILEAQDEEPVSYLSLRRVLAVALVVLLLILCTVPLAAAQTDPAAPAARSLAAGSDGIFINEVMFAPAPGGYEWVELKNGSGSPVRLAGYRLTDEDGNWYRIPAATAACACGSLRRRGF